MIIRPKDPARVREDALRVAARKLVGGCRPCADAYINLARRNGASEEEIRRVSQPEIWLGDSAPTSGFLGSSSTLPGAQQAPESRGGYVDPLGSDGNTSPAAWYNASELQFYIGRLGHGITPDSSPSVFFNTGSATAKTVGPNTYGYWNVQGPCMIPSLILNPPHPPPNYDPYYWWGVAQAAVALGARARGPFARYIQGLALFATVEGGGWDTVLTCDPSTGNCTVTCSPTPTQNQSVLNGFLDAVTLTCCEFDSHTGTCIANCIPGVYINIGKDGGNLFGPNYTYKNPFVLWATGQICSLSICGPATGDCAPCACDPANAVETNWKNIVQNACWAGQGAALWQFWETGCKTSQSVVCPPAKDGDFNYSPYLPLTPLPCTGGSCRSFQERSVAARVDALGAFTYAWAPAGSPGSGSYVAQSNCFPSGYANYYLLSVSGGAGNDYSQYGFSIPSSATVTGIEVTATFNPNGAHYHYDQGSCPPVDLDTPSASAPGNPEITLSMDSFLSPCGIGGAGPPANPPTTPTIGTNVYGGPNDLWGYPCQVTPAMVNSNKFGATLGISAIDGCSIIPPGWDGYVRTEHASLSSNPDNPPAPIASVDLGISVSKIRVYYSF